MEIKIKTQGRDWGWWMVQAGAPDPPLVNANLGHGRAMTCGIKPHPYFGCLGPRLRPSRSSKTIRFIGKTNKGNPHAQNLIKHVVY